MRGYETIFQYVRIFVGIVLGIFADGVLDHFPICGTRIHLHACHNGMDRANGDEILAPSDAIDVCVSKHQSALIGGDGDFISIHRTKGPRMTTGPKARGYRPARR